MAIERVSIRDNFVYRDSINTFRWYDAVGPHVVKYIQEFLTIPSDDTTGDPTEWTATVVEIGAGTSTAVVTDVLGGALLITTAANENDGWSMQLGAAAGENFSFAAEYPTYLGVKLQINDADQTDVLVGLTVTDTAVLAAVTDGIYFRSVDATGVCNFVLEKDSVENEVAANTMTDATDVILEFLYSGSNVYAYANGVLMTTIANTNASFPNDELLRLTVEFLTGEAVANTCQIAWLKVIQIQN